MTKVTNLAGRKFVARINAMAETLKGTQALCEEIIQLNRAIRASFHVPKKPSLSLVPKTT